MAFLNQGQYQQYLQFKSGGLNTQPQRKTNILENILGSIVSPFGKLQAIPFETAKTIEYGLGKKFAPNQYQEEYAGKYLLPEDYARWKANPLLETAKPVAGVASWLVPAGGLFGSGVKGLAASGAVSGGLSGFGASEPGQEISGTLKGAGTGAVIGGGLGLLGEKLGKVKPVKNKTELQDLTVKLSNNDITKTELAKLEATAQMGDDILAPQAQMALNLGGGTGQIKQIATKGAIRPETYAKTQPSVTVGEKATNRVGQFGWDKTSIKNIGGYNKALEVSDDVYKTLDEMGLPVSNRVQRSMSVSEAIPVLGKQADDIAQASSVTLDGTKYLQELKSAFKNNPALLEKSSGKEIVNIIKGLGDNPSGYSVRQAIQSIDDIAGGYSKLVEGSAEKLRVYNTARDILRSDLGKSIPAINEPLSKLHNLKEIQDVVSSYSATKSNLPLLTRVGVKVPITRQTDWVQNALIGKGIKPRLGVNATNLLTTGAKYLPPLLGAQQGKGVEATSQTEMQGLTSQNLNTQGGQELGQAGTSGTSGQSTGIALALLGSGMKPADVKTVIGLLGLSSTGEGKMLPASSLKDLSDINESISLLNTQLVPMYQQSKSAFGPITGTLRGINPWDVTGQNAKATIKIVKQIIGKGLEGGVLRKEDEYKYEQILPKLGDKPEVVEYKINGLNQVLQAKYNTLVSTYQQGGYNPYAGGGGEMVTEGTSNPYYEYY